MALPRGTLPALHLGRDPPAGSRAAAGSGAAARCPRGQLRHHEMATLEGGNMRALLTSSGIKNRSIHHALIDLLGKPIAESNALFIPTAVYPFPGGPGMAWRAISGKGP